MSSLQSGPQVSVILPVYNGEKYLTDTLDSLLKQSYRDFEIIVVDDGSVDNSVNIIRDFMLEDNRIVLIKQKNQGICTSRNNGLKMAKGKYIMFCDHDDTYDSEFISIAFNHIAENDYDFVKFGCREIYVESNKINDCQLINKTYENNCVDILFQYSNLNEYIWDGIYTKKVISQVGGFDTSFVAGCEDIDILIKISKYSKKCKLVEGMYYNHFIRDASSTSRKYNKNTRDAVIKMFIERINSVSTTNQQLLYTYYQDKLFQLLWALLGMFSFKNCNLKRKDIINTFKKVRELKEVENFFKTYKGNITSKKSLILSIMKFKLYHVFWELISIKKGRLL